MKGAQSLYPGAGHEPFTFLFAVQADHDTRGGIQKSPEIVEQLGVTPRERGQAQFGADVVIEIGRYADFAWHMFTHGSGNNKRVTTIQAAFREAHELDPASLHGRMKAALLHVAFEPWVEFRPGEAHAAVCRGGLHVFEHGQQFAAGSVIFETG